MQLLDEAGEATTVTGPEEAPSAPSVMAREEVAEIFGRALAAQPERPAVFILHFKPDSDELTNESMSLVPAILDAIDLRRSVDTSVIGHTDTIGAREYNYELSRKRAQKIRDLLVSRGVAPDILDVTSHGEENLLVPTDDETEEPRNRRVDALDLASHLNSQLEVFISFPKIVTLVVDASQPQVGFTGNGFWRGAGQVKDTAKRAFGLDEVCFQCLNHAQSGQCCRLEPDRSSRSHRQNLLFLDPGSNHFQLDCTGQQPPRIGFAQPDQRAGDGPRA